MTRCWRGALGGLRHAGSPAPEPIIDRLRIVGLRWGTMFKLLLASVVVVPVLGGMQAAKSKSARRGLLLLLAFLVGYGLLYVIMLYYLDYRWVG